MTECIYNNVKNTSIGHISFKLNYRYHPRVSFKDDANSYSKFCQVKELAKKFRDLIFNCQQNLLHA